MRHGVKINKLGRNASHRKAMLGNLATSILRQGLAKEQRGRSIRTTLAKARTVRSVVERLVTFAKKGDLAARRQAARVIHDHEVLQGLFSTIGPRYKDRQGGYTRILKLAEERAGDAAQMALIELVEDQVKARRRPIRKAATKPLDITTRKVEPATVAPAEETADRVTPVT